MKNLLKIIVSVLILFTLFYKIGIQEIISNLLTTNPLAILFTLLILIFSLILGALNIYILTLPLKIKFKKILKYSLISWSLGLFVPAKLGEFSLIAFLKKEGVSIGQGTVISILDKLVTFIILSLLSILGFLIFFNLETTLILSLILLLTIVFSTFFLVSNFGRNLIKKYILRKYAEKFEGFSKYLFHFLKKEKALLALNFIVTFFKWLVTSLMIYILLISFNQDISFIYVFLINSMLIIISLIPISISGLGVRESAAVFIYSFLNIETSITLTVYIIATLITYLTGAFILLSNINLDYNKP